MELILISESKLKIMLTRDDMETYSVTSESMSYEESHTRKMFDKILGEAKEKIGFDFEGDRLFIQVYPSKNGGCEVYVTCNVTDEKTDKKPKDRNTTPKKRREYCVYSFESLNDAVRACNVIRRCGYKNDSSFYIEERGELARRYYVVLQEDITQVGQTKRKRNVCTSDVATEFGKKVGGREALMYVLEHADVIVERNAVETVGRLD